MCGDTPFTGLKSQFQESCASFTVLFPTGVNKRAERRNEVIVMMIVLSSRVADESDSGMAVIRITRKVLATRTGSIAFSLK